MQQHGQHLERPGDHLESGEEARIREQVVAAVTGVRGAHIPRYNTHNIEDMSNIRIYAQWTDTRAPVTCR